VRFENQVAEGGQGIPDAVIAASVRILLETKIRRNAVSIMQPWDALYPQNFKLVVGKNRFGKTGGTVIFQHRDEGVVEWSQNHFDDPDWVCIRGGRTAEQLAAQAASRRLGQQIANEYYYGPPVKGFWGVVSRVLGCR
jgi:hypothetical protein